MIALSRYWWREYCRDHLAPDLWCAIAEWPALVPFPPPLQDAVQVTFIALVRALKLGPVVN